MRVKVKYVCNSKFLCLRLDSRCETTPLGVAASHTSWWWRHNVAHCCGMDFLKNLFSFDCKTVSSWPWLCIIRYKAMGPCGRRHSFTNRAAIAAMRHYLFPRNAQFGGLNAKENANKVGMVTWQYVRSIPTTYLPFWCNLPMCFTMFTEGECQIHNMLGCLLVLLNRHAGSIAELDGWGE